MAGMPTSRTVASVRASFEPRYGEVPAGWHVVKKPGHTGGRQAVREPAQPGPLNATKPGSQPTRPGQWRLLTSRRECVRAGRLGLLSVTGFPAAFVFARQSSRVPTDQVARLRSWRPEAFAPVCGRSARSPRGRRCIKIRSACSCWAITKGRPSGQLRECFGRNARIPALCANHGLASIMTAAILILAFCEPGAGAGQDR